MCILYLFKNIIKFIYLCLTPKRFGIYIKFFIKLIFMTNVIVWNENIHEIENEAVKKIYPNGIHNCIKDFLSKDSKL